MEPPPPGPWPIRTDVGPRPRGRGFVPPRMPTAARPASPETANPAPPPLLNYGRAPEHPVRRWLRLKREFLAEEMIAYRQVGISVVFGLVVAFFFVLRYPRLLRLVWKLFVR